jgi:hypothetical protein
MADQIKADMHTRTLEVCVNRLLRALDELNLDGVERVFVASKMLEHLETQSGIRIDRALLNPDKPVKPT